jgi:Protein of unknown function (DUF1676)
MFRSAISLCLVSLLVGRIVAQAPQPQEKSEEQARGGKSYFGDVQFLFKTYQDCSASDLNTCLKLRLYSILDRVARSNKDLKLTEGITFARDVDAPVDSTPVKTEKEIEAALPRSLEDKDSSLNSLIFDKIMSFFKGHTLQVSKT